MLQDIVAVSSLGGYRLLLRFEDGVEGVVDFGLISVNRVARDLASLRCAEFRGSRFAAKFGEDEFFYGLQLADMYAYCVRQSLERPGAETDLVKRLRGVLEKTVIQEEAFQYRLADGLGDGKLVTRPHRTIQYD